MIFRRTLQNKFTAISNAICVDESISTDARWCLWYLLTKPVDWEVRVNDIRRVSGWGKNKTYNVVNELIAAKYLVVSQNRSEGGQFGPANYDVYDEPFTGSPFPENRDTEKRDTGNGEHTKDTEEQKTEKKPKTEKDISVDFDFEEFWAAYPRRNGPNPKIKAREKYAQARRAKVSHETLMAGVNKLAASRKGEDPKFTPQAATWLNQRRWEDDNSIADSIPDVSQEFFDEIANGYPGVVDPGVRLELAKMISGGIQPVEITDAAMKLRLLDKQRRADGIPMPIPPLSKWLKFRWREMEGYEFCRSGMGNKLSVRPIRKG